MAIRNVPDRDGNLGVWLHHGEYEKLIKDAQQGDRMINKTCTTCKYFWFHQAQECWSEVTPGNEFSMSCDKDHWSFDPYDITPEQLHAIMIAGDNCPDFELREPTKVPG